MAAEIEKFVSVDSVDYKMAVITLHYWAKTNDWEYLGKYPANIYLFKVNNRNIRKRSEICSK